MFTRWRVRLLGSMTCAWLMCAHWGAEDGAYASPVPLAQGAASTVFSTKTAGFGAVVSKARQRVARRRRRHRRRSRSRPKPKIEPVAPLPIVFRRVNVTSQPSGLPIEVRDQKKKLLCRPANRTPCMLQIVGYTKEVHLLIVLRRGSQVLRYRRTVTGRSTKHDLWQLRVPAVIQPLTPPSVPVFRMTTRRLPPRAVVPRRRLLPRPAPRTHVKNGPPAWVWVVSSVVLAGAATGVVLYAIMTRNQLGFSLSP